MTYSLRASSKWPNFMSLAPGELNLVDPEVEGCTLLVDLELNAVHLRRIHALGARVAPALHLRHCDVGDDVLRPLLGQLQVHAEVVEALRAHLAVGVGVGVRHFEAHGAGRARAL